MTGGIDHGGFSNTTPKHTIRGMHTIEEAKEEEHSGISPSDKKHDSPTLPPHSAVVNQGQAVYQNYGQYRNPEYILPQQNTPPYGATISTTTGNIIPTNNYQNANSITTSINPNITPISHTTNINLPQTVTTTSGFVQGTGSGFSANPVQPQQAISGPTSKTTSALGIARKPTTDGGNTSLLNQSLNTSIRIHKSILKKVDQSVAEGAGKNADDSSVIELNIDDDGFLLDAQGNYILDDRGQPMKLDEDKIEFLKEHGLYEEEEIEGGN